MQLRADWLIRPEVQAVMDLLGSAFFVGGCVRNTLLDLPATDIDIATPLRPQAVMDRAKAAGFTTVPTGIEHGTVTIVIDGTPFEVTTLRRDIETDGRHATVVFTENLDEDAARRDFTMNALYATADGTVIDPVGGLPDLSARRIRFVGDAAARIVEDYLRVLRFFRFTALYGRGLDAEGLAACARHVGGLHRLARERIGHEMRRLLGARDPAEAVAAMASTGVLDAVLPGAGHVDALPALVEMERAVGVDPDWRTRLALLDPSIESDPLRFSREDARALAALCTAVDTDDPLESAYRFGAETALASILIRAALGGGHAPDAALMATIAEAAQRPLPIAARDLLAAGIPAGPALGRALKQVETEWLASGMTRTAGALIASALQSQTDQDP